MVRVSPYDPALGLKVKKKKKALIAALGTKL
jgi:hypothetical protein